MRSVVERLVVTHYWPHTVKTYSSYKHTTAVAMIGYVRIYPQSLSSPFVIGVIGFTVISDHGFTPVILRESQVSANPSYDS